MTFPEAPISPLERRPTLKHTWSQGHGRHPLCLRSRLDVPSQHPPEYSHYRQLVPLPGSFWQRPICLFRMTFHGAYIDRHTMTGPQHRHYAHAYVPSSPRDNAELTLSLCGSGIDSEKTHQKMTWKVIAVLNLSDSTDFAGGITLYQRANVSGVV
jgi:hypothetical protein